MNKDEFGAMVRACGGKKHKSKEIAEIFNRLDDGDDGTPGEISYEQFEAWFLEEMKSDVRAARVLARQIFKLVDVDGSGTLSKSEFSHIAHELASKFPHLQLDPPFDLEIDWRNLCLAAAGADEAVPEAVAWDDFERWWRERAGDDESTIPVLPEAMVNRVAAMSAHTTMQRLQEDNPHWSEGSARWAFLKPRLLSLLRMQTVWGKISDLYGSSESVYKDPQSLPPGIRSPESRFTRVWDLVQLVCIVYIAVAIPWRLGFNIAVPISSVTFWWDVLVDVHFIADTVLNFRLAYYHTDGVLETDRHKIRNHYLRTWFFVDFLASVPITWVVAIYQKTTDPMMRSIKSVRLLRLLKMLRVARIMKLLDRYARYTDWTVAMSSFLSMLTIMYATHLLACFWYMAGDTNELGWVHRLLSEPTKQCPVCPNIHPFNRYAYAMYTVLLMGDTTAVSAAEKGYAIFSYCVIIVIQGALAGLMSQLMMSSRMGEQEYIIKLAQLKAWMKARQFSRRDSRRIMMHFTANNQSSTYFDEKEILTFLPTGISRELSLQMYHDVLEQSPLFRLLGRELLLRLCEAAIPVSVVRSQTVFKTGDVGHEMYFVMRGEVEVVGADNTKLGFIGHGGFFGERTVIEAVGRKFGSGSCLRGRTVSATIDSDLVMLETDTILSICDVFPELEVRLRSFKRIGINRGRKGKAAEAARSLRKAASSGKLGQVAEETEADTKTQTAESEVDGEGVTTASQSEWVEAGRRLLQCSGGDLKLAIARLMGAFHFC